MITDAKWITSPRDFGQAGVVFQKSIKFNKPVKKATLYASCLGVYNALIDGKKVGDGVLAPGWTVYRKRVQYQTYDVTKLIKDDCTLAFECGVGWAVGSLCVTYQNKFSANTVCVIASLEVEFADGESKSVITDESWLTYTSEVLFSELYDGETQDKTAPVQKVGNATCVTPTTSLIPQEGEWIKEHERLAPLSVIKTPKGETVIDFGQNMAGYVEFRIKAKRGERIVASYAEVLDRDGNFYTENYRRAQSKTIYVCSGENDVFKPKFSFQGFRYIRLDSYPAVPLNLDDIRAIAVHSDLKRTGDFCCGNEKINRLYHNVVWGQKSNYLDIPTDCPQRDERLGWTGDTQVFCRTGAINYNVKNFFKKWLNDLSADQRKNGAVPAIVPIVRVGEDCDGMRVSAGWGDAACICPWEIYLAYGDKALLKENFPSMKRWVDYLHGAGEDEFLWLNGFHHGDWLAMDAGEGRYVGATSCDLIASAYYAYSTSLLIKAGKAIGEDVSKYETLYASIVKRFREYFMDGGMPRERLPYTEIVPKGERPVDNDRKGVTQTSLAIILHFNLCEKKDRKRLTKKLVELIESNGMKMNTGFLGTPYILHALSENGRCDIAYNLLFQEQSPSWLYSVNHGATTMWEHWDSLKEDGSFWSADMNSFNHYAYGAVYDWIFGVAVGIKPSEKKPGYAVTEIAPHPDKRLGFAKAHIDTAKGKISVHWYYKGDTVYYEITVPSKVKAHLTLPSGRKTVLSGGTFHFAE